ncbi:MAG: glycosyltransferase [Candidatus Methylomirabilota bacterium]
MRICDLTTLWIDGGTCGGVNTYLAEKARYLAQRGGAEHVIIVPGEHTRKQLLYDSTLYTIKSPRLPSNPSHRVLWNRAAVRKILQDERPSVVEVDCASLLGKVAAGTLRAGNVPVIGFYHVHLPTFIARPAVSRFGSTVSRVTERLTWVYVRYCNRHCDRLIVTSRDIHQRLTAEGFTRLEYVPLGVNLTLFRPEANGNGHPVTLLYVGRLSREKDLHVLIDAFKLLAARGDYRLNIVGEGPLRDRLERQAAGDLRIAFLGPLEYGEALARIYASADVFTLPSPNETFNLAVLEALASGIPVVGVRQGGPVDLVHPWIGSLAEPANAADLAAKIEQVVAEKNGGVHTYREYVEQNFSWERTFTRLLSIYGEVIAVRNGHGNLAAFPGERDNAF